MTDHDDDLERLRRADPVDPTRLPSAHDPEAAALFEEITMEKRSRVGMLVAAAAVVALIGGVAAVMAGGDSDAGDKDVAQGVTTTQAPITPGGPSAGSCVEIYDLSTLANRDHAFDGTVKAVDGDAVTFTVNAWFKGGEADEVTLQGAAGLSGLTSAGPHQSLDPGDRLLVAGDAEFAWACGFTQPYDTAVAEEWERALMP